MNKTIAVIGGGPAGIEAALAAAGRGRRVILVQDGPLGGRAVWQTLMPAKIWLDAARQAELCQCEIQISVLRERYIRAAETWQNQLGQRLRNAGVEWWMGTAAFETPHRLQVKGGQQAEESEMKHLEVDAVIIATGSVAYHPPGLQPDGKRVMAPHLIMNLERLPESLVVVGAGGPATEYVDVFSRLGVKLTWVTGPVGILSAFPPDAGHFVADVMARRGVHIVEGVLARDIASHEKGVLVKTVGGADYEAELALVAIGNRPDLSRLNLGAAGLQPGITSSSAIDGYGRTQVPHIYLVGDAAVPLAVNASQAQGRTAGLHASGARVEPISMESVVLAVYSQPEVAVVGRMSDPFVDFQTTRVPFQDTLATHLNFAEREGFLDLVYDSNQRVVGGLAVGPDASQVLAPVAVAIRMRATLSDLARVYAAHPTYTELAFWAARLGQ